MRNLLLQLVGLTLSLAPACTNILIIYFSWVKLALDQRNGWSSIYMCTTNGLMEERHALTALRHGLEWYNIIPCDIGVSLEEVDC